MTIGQEQATDPAASTTEETVTLTQAELQSLMDSKITAALKTRESNLEAKYSQLIKTVEEDKEKEKRSSLEEVNKLLDEYKNKAARYELEMQTKEALKEVEALDIADMFDYDTSSVEGRKAFALAFKNRLKSSVEAEIKNKLNTSNTVTTKDTKPVEFKAGMDNENAKAFLASLGIKPK